MTDEQSNQERRESDATPPGAGLALGAGIGVAVGAGIGAAMGNVAVGAGVGIALGAGLALLVPLFKR